MPNKKGANERNQPKSLTTKQRRFLDQLIERFGEGHTNIKRAELKKAAREILGTAAAPAWITRNLTVRSKDKRGMYDLSVLAKLPTVDPVEETPAEKPADKPAAKKAAAKKAAAKKAAAKKAAAKKTAAKKSAAPPPTPAEDEADEDEDEDAPDADEDEEADEDESDEDEDEDGE